MFPNFSNAVFWNAFLRGFYFETRVLKVIFFPQCLCVGFSSICLNFWWMLLFFFLKVWNLVPGFSILLPWPLDVKLLSQTFVAFTNITFPKSLASASSYKHSNFPLPVDWRILAWNLVFLFKVLILWLISIASAVLLVPPCKL